MVGCNFCPFAAQVVKKQSVQYEVSAATSEKEALSVFFDQLRQLDADPAVDTTLLIFPDGFADFFDYLNLLHAAEALLEENDYEGVYQVASFHPLYQFAGSPASDAANYTNRSPYPMLHLLREAQVTEALKFYKHPEEIPGRNIAFAREKGLAYMQLLRQQSMNQ